jgi:hypothetical protein
MSIITKILNKITNYVYSFTLPKKEIQIIAKILGQSETFVRVRSVGLSDKYRQVKINGKNVSSKELLEDLLDSS